MRSPLQLQGAACRAYRHEHRDHQARLRAALLAFVEDVDADDDAQAEAQELADYYGKVAEKLHACASFGRARVPLADPKRASWCPCHCDQPLCRICHPHRVRQTRARARHILSQCTDRVRFITLTLHRRPGDPRDAYKEASAALLRLRRRMAWKTHVDGGMAAFEMTYRNDGTWLPHWHVLTVGRYWQSRCDDWLPPAKRPPDWRPTCAARCAGGAYGNTPANHEPAANCRRCRCLHCEWEDVTGGDFIVDIREADDPVVEATKYVTKAEDLPDAALLTWFARMRKVRRFRWFGFWQGVNLPDENTSEPAINCAPGVLYHIAEGQPMQLEVDGLPEDLFALPASFQVHWPDFDGVPTLEEIEDLRPTVLVVLDPGWARRAYEALEEQLAGLAATSEQRRLAALAATVPY